MSHTAGTQPKMYRNLEILGEARVGMQNCRFCWTASAKVIMCAYWRLGAFPCSSNPVFLKLLVLLFRLLSAQTPKFPMSWGVQQCAGLSPMAGMAPGLLAAWLGLSPALQLGRAFSRALWASPPAVQGCCISLPGSAAQQIQAQLPQTWGVGEQEKHYSTALGIHGMLVPLCRAVVSRCHTQLWKSQPLWCENCK